MHLLQTGLGNRRAHSEECRILMEQAIQHDEEGQLRVQNYKERADEWISEQLGGEDAQVVGQEVQEENLSALFPSAGDGRTYEPKYAEVYGR